MRTGAVVLAAGKSSRMGVNKLLLEVGGVKVLDRLLDTLTQAVDHIVVVTGNNPDPIAAIAVVHGVLVVHNPEHEKGMFTSFQAGLKLVRNSDAVFLVLGDQLGLKSELLTRMVMMMEDLSGSLIVSPVHEGKRGHPVLFRSTLFDEILSLKGTLKEIVDKHADAQAFVEGDEWSTIDFDTPSEFERAKNLFEEG